MKTKKRRLEKQQEHLQQTSKEDFQKQCRRLKRLATFILAGTFWISGCSSTSVQPENRKEESTVNEADQTDSAQSPDSTDSQKQAGKEAEHASSDEIFSRLKTLSPQTSKEQMRDVMNELLVHTASSMNYSLTLSEDASTSSVATDADRQFYVQDKSLSSSKTLLLEPDVLYEIIRQGATGSRTPYIGLAAVGPDTSQIASFSLDNNMDVFEPHPSVVLNMYMNNPASHQSENLQAALRSEVINTLLAMLGADLPVPFYNDPSLYSYSLKKNEEGYTLVIEPENHQVYNQYLDESADTPRTDLFETGNYLADTFTTQKASIELMLSDQAVLKQSHLQVENEFVYQGQTWHTGVDRTWQAEEVQDPALVQMLPGLFEQMESGQLKSGDSLVLFQE